MDAHGHGEKAAVAIEVANTVLRASSGSETSQAIKFANAQAIAQIAIAEALLAVADEVRRAS